MKSIVTYLPMCYMLFAICSFVTADTIPPLPIDELKKIELHYNDTLSKPFPIDTFYLQLYGGNVYGGSLNIVRPIKPKTILSLHATATKNYDYADYLLLDSDIAIGWLTNHFWHPLGFSIMRNNKELRYYENIEINYDPIWFISDATVQLNNCLRGARYIDLKTNNFLTANSNLSFCLPSQLGIIKNETEILFQSTKKIRDKNNFFTQTKLSDLITFGDDFYIQPGVNYAINQDQLGINISSGFLTNGITTFLNLSYNSVKSFYFDTLYSYVYPYLVNNDLDYPICNWDITLSVLWKDFQLSGNYRKFSSHINWMPQDSWITPQNCDTAYNEIGFNIKNKKGGFSNTFGINYTSEKLNLIPNFIIKDSIQADIDKFDIIGSMYVCGNRRWYHQILPRYILLNCQAGYTWKFLKVFTRIENIFDNKYAMFPTQPTLGRKYLAGLEIKK